MKQLSCGAVQNGHHDCEKLLLEAGADVNAQDKDGRTALMMATRNGHDKCVELLIERGVDVNVKDNDGRTALMPRAIPQEELMKRQLKKVIGPILMPSVQKTKKPGDHDECFKMLIETGADVNIQNKRGCSALMFTSCQGHHECQKLLLEAGADVDLQNNNGFTALMLAARKGCGKCVKLLIKAGADLNIRNTNGDTALMLAADRGHGKCIELLIRIVADVRCAIKSHFKLPVTKQKRIKFLLLLFSAGVNLSQVSREYLQEAIPETELSLKNICREATRNHLLKLDPNGKSVHQGTQASNCLKLYRVTYCMIRHWMM